jgi:hypothetical protein
VGRTRLRVTLRTMMAVVAFLAIGLSLAVWMARREAQFRALRDHHRVLFRQNHFPANRQAQRNMMARIVVLNMWNMRSRIMQKPGLCRRAFRVPNLSGCGA